MKRVIGRLIIFAAALLSACGPVVPEGGADADNNYCFTIEVSDISATAANLTIKPSDALQSYYFDILREEYFLAYGTHGFQRFIDKVISDYMSVHSLTKSAALSELLSVGDKVHSFSGLTPQTRYYAIVVGVSSEGEITTEVASEQFCTSKDNDSINSFTIELSEVSYTGVSYRVVPTAASQSYILLPYCKAIVDAYSDEEFIGYALRSFGATSSHILSGEQSGVISSCVPGRDYYIVVFGYDGNEATTALTKASFTTRVGANPAECGFAFRVSDIGVNQAQIAITPTHDIYPYIWGVMEQERYQVRAAEVGQQAAMNEVLQQVIAAAAEQNGGIHEALERTSAYGSVNSSGIHDNLLQGTHYIPWAVCIDSNGNAAAPFILGESFRTQGDSLPACYITVKGSYYKGDDGKAVLVSTAQPRNACAGYYNTIFVGDHTTTPRQTLLKNIVAQGAENCAKVEFEHCDWNQVVTAIAVAYDSDGNFGEIAMDVFTPIEE